jgi:hypothetical protein
LILHQNQSLPLTLFDESTGALCLDGTPAGYYYEPGTVNNYIFFFDGGDDTGGFT